MKRCVPKGCEARYQNSFSSTQGHAIEGVRDGSGLEPGSIHALFLPEFGHQEDNDRVDFKSAGKHAEGEDPFAQEGDLAVR